MHVRMALQVAATRTLCKHVFLSKVMAFNSRPTLSFLVWLTLVTSSLGAFAVHVPVNLASDTDREQQHDTLYKQKRKQSMNSARADLQDRRKQFIVARALWGRPASDKWLERDAASEVQA